MRGDPARPAEPGAVLVGPQELDYAVGDPPCAVVLFRQDRLLRLMIQQVSHAVLVADVPVADRLEVHQVVVVLAIPRRFLHQQHPMEAVVLPRRHEVHLADRLGQVARVGEDPRQRGNRRVDRVARILVMPVHDATLAGQQAVPGWNAHRVRRMGVAVQAALGGKPIEVRRDDVRIAHAADGVITLLIGEQKQNVRFVCGH